jgi:putative SOS response-associated peptidase YedK
MTLTRRELQEVADELEAACDVQEHAAYRARYNVAPTDTHPVLRLVQGERRLSPARWGLPPPPRRRAPLINVRTETLRPLLAGRAPGGFLATLEAPLREGRCVVPADGFFEWKEGAPIWFHRADGRLLLFAGLYLDGAFTVLTTTPNALVAEVHDRMPAILSPDEAEAWLLAPAERLLHPAGDGVLAARPVSSRVNSVRHDDPACLEAPAAPAPAQLSLL